MLRHQVHSGPHATSIRRLNAPVTVSKIYNTDQVSSTAISLKHHQQPPCPYNLVVLYHHTYQRLCGPILLVIFMQDKLRHI